MDEKDVPNWADMEEKANRALKIAQEVSERLDSYYVDTSDTLQRAVLAAGVLNAAMIGSAGKPDQSALKAAEWSIKPPFLSEITCPEFSEVLKLPPEGFELERSVWSFHVRFWSSKWKLLCCKCLLLHSWLLTLGPKFSSQLECLKCRMHNFVRFLLKS